MLTGHLKHQAFCSTLSFINTYLTLVWYVCKINFEALSLVQVLPGLPSSIGMVNFAGKLQRTFKTTKNIRELQNILDPLNERFCTWLFFLHIIMNKIRSNRHSETTGLHMERFIDHQTSLLYTPWKTRLCAERSPTVLNFSASCSRGKELLASSFLSHLRSFYRHSWKRLPQLSNRINALLLQKNCVHLNLQWSRCAYYDVPTYPISL